MTNWADISEWQHAIDWQTYGNHFHIACSRLAYGANYTDLYAAANIAGSRKYVRYPGWYQYLVASQDPVAQADKFASLIGKLGDYEWAMLDIEEGGGDQTPRALAWRQRMAEHFGPGRTCVYSYRSFFITQLASLPNDWPRIVADYGTPPTYTLPVVAWQWSSNVITPGITGGCDNNYSPLNDEALLPYLGANMMTPEQFNIVNSKLDRLLASNTRIEDMSGPNGGLVKTAQLTKEDTAAIRKKVGA